jgi:hypothetical protein
MILNIEIQQQKTYVKFHIVLPMTALTYLCNLAGSDYKLPEDDTTVSKYVGAA